MNRNGRSRIIGTALVGLALMSFSVVAVESSSELAETKEQRDARMKWWREAKFGMFIHWGVYSVPAGTYHGQQIPRIGEWIMFNAKIPVAEYRAFAREFNPTKYNPEAWALLAREAGMRYMTITSKHHDGFALFETKASDWNVVDATPYGKDLIKPLAEATRRQGLKFGLYYSQSQDWVNPGGAKNKMGDGDGWDDAHKGRYDDYLKKVAEPQVREILMQYQPDVLWWDTTRMMTPERAKPLHDLLALRPGIITNNRLGGGYSGDTETPEQFVPVTGYPGRDWETCMTMNDTWGFKSYDQNWKSTETLVRTLIDVVSKGGNYLLNVGPTAEGEIPQASIERLKQIGAWMKVNDEAIYTTTPSPFRRQLPWGRCTQKPGKLFLHVFDWPMDGKLLVPVANTIRKTYLLAAPDRELTTSNSDEGVEIRLPASAPDPIASVVVAEIDGEARPLTQPIQQSADGTLSLTAVDADIHGSTAKLEGRTEMNIGSWKDTNDYVSWPARIVKPGTYDVEIVFACDYLFAGSDFILSIGEHRLTGSVPGTGDEAKTYYTTKLPSVTIDKPGTLLVTLMPIKKPGAIVMNLRSVVLKPVEK
jgi:alpha-L-fucosidase